jgi:plasmid replication initiation protein
MALSRALALLSNWTAKYIQVRSKYEPLGDEVWGDDHNQLPESLRQRVVREADQVTSSVPAVTPASVLILHGSQDNLTAALRPARAPAAAEW